MPPSVVHMLKGGFRRREVVLLVNGGFEDKFRPGTVVVEDCRDESPRGPANSQD